MYRKRVNRRIQPKPESNLKLKIRFSSFIRGRIINSLSIFLLVLGFYKVAVWFIDRPVEVVKVEGDFLRVSSPQVEAAMREYLDESFLSVDIKQLQTEIAKIPWVKIAIVSRAWPDTLKVLVKEEEVAARWGDTGLVNTSGQVFVESATHIPAELPRLDGPEGSSEQIALQFFKIRSRLEQVGLVAVSLKQDPRGALELKMSNGISVRFGAVNLNNRIDRFFLAINRVLSSIAERIDYVDMRYTNGFAIGWKVQGQIKFNGLKERDPHA
ncbi:MAG: FtsQ-type POTRA domain-containing protein [Pseudomonadota bacterium]|nr:FtsQ-type POTRA domain-containing protein [Pseudomonadota bacterium]